MDNDDVTWRTLSQVADRGTTRSFKRTINAAILLRAAQRTYAGPATPRKAPSMATLFGIAGLSVSPHEQALQLLIHNHL
jgi:hypothetical protein